MTVKTPAVQNEDAAGFPGRELVSAVPLIALLVMILNDHWLRLRWPSWFTGKLSDFAVVLYFPFLLTATTGLLLWAADRIIGRLTKGCSYIDYRLTRARLAGALGITGLGLASINLSPALGDLYVAALTRLDLLHLFGRFT